MISLQFVKTSLSLSFYFIFDELSVTTQYLQTDETTHLGFYCLCPIKKMPDLCRCILSKHVGWLVDLFLTS